MEGVRVISEVDFMCMLLEACTAASDTMAEDRAPVLLNRSEG